MLRADDLDPEAEVPRHGGCGRVDEGAGEGVGKGVGWERGSGAAGGVTIVYQVRWRDGRGRVALVQVSRTPPQ